MFNWKIFYDTKWKNSKPMLPLDQQHSLASVPWKTTLCHTHWTPSPWVAHTWVLCCGVHRQLLTPTVDILVTSALWTPAAQKFLSFFFKFSRSSERKTRQHWFSMFFLELLLWLQCRETLICGRNSIKSTWSTFLNYLFVFLRQCW